MTYRLVEKLLERNSDWAPPAGAEVADGCAYVIQAWLNSLTPVKRNHWIDLRVMRESHDRPEQCEVLTYDFRSDYDKHVHLKKACAQLETAEPGLGAQLLATLMHVNYRVCDIGTPAMVAEMARHELWYGANSDAELVQELLDMGYEDDEVEGFELTPDGYRSSLGTDYAALCKSGSKLWTLKRLKSLGARRDATGAVATLMCEVRQRFKACTNPRDLACHCSDVEQPLEPAFMFWWGPDNTDEMDKTYYAVYQQRFESSEQDVDGLLHVNLRSEQDLNTAIAWIEQSVPFLDAVERLRLQLWSNCNE